MIIIIMIIIISIITTIIIIIIIIIINNNNNNNKDLIISISKIHSLFPEYKCNSRHSGILVFAKK